jgi:probable F420-dependent oxidoreductase
MKYGLFGACSGVCAQPHVAKRIAVLAEDLGFDSLWTGEHVVLPNPRQPPSPAEPDYPMLHPSTGLAYLAAVTNRIYLGTGIVLIAQRNPLVLAKETASLDVVSNGRLILGIGAGYLYQEFAALGIPFEERGPRTDEAIAILRNIWNDDSPAFSGRFWQYRDIQAMPRPVQAGGPPIVVGGASDAALKRAIRSAQGWYGFAMNPPETKHVLDRLEVLAQSVPRDATLGTLEISLSPRVRLDEPTVREFENMGVHRLIALMPQDEEAKLATFVETLGRTFIN